MTARIVYMSVCDLARIRSSHCSFCAPVRCLVRLRGLLLLSSLLGLHCEASVRFVMVGADSNVDTVSPRLGGRVSEAELAGDMFAACIALVPAKISCGGSLRLDALSRKL
eukprot:3559588-Rhodomonas_salina.2